MQGFKNTKKALFPLGIAVLTAGILVLSGCKMSSSSTASTTTGDSTEAATTSEDNATVSYTSASTSASGTSYTPAEGEKSIVLADGASTSDSSNVSIDNTKNIIVINALGTYVLSGSLSDGSVIITAEESTSDDTVELILNGVYITNKGTHTYTVGTTTIYPGPIYSVNSAKLHVKALSGSSSVIKDSRATSLEDGDDNAAIFSNKLLKIKGSGSLAVIATHNNGLASDSKVKAATATLSVTALNCAIKAHEEVVLGGSEAQGSFTLKSTSSDTTNYGCHAIRVDDATYSVATPVYGNSDSIDDDIAGIEIKDGAYVISSVGGNAISSETYTYMVGGNGTITSTSGKGITATNGVIINGGSFSVTTSKDDCIHSSSGYVACGGGSYTLTTGTSSGCQGIKGATKLTITGGTFNIKNSYEGISAPIMNVSGGITSVVATDDGWNAGGTGKSADNSCSLTISGGTHYVYAGGDGLDSNGYFYIKGGNIVVCAPSSGGNAPLDSGDSADGVHITGGNIVAYGVSGMTETVQSDGQNAVVLGSHTSVASGKYYVVVQGDNKWAVKANRASTTFTCSMSDFTSGSVAIYSTSDVTVSETLCEAGSFYKVSAYGTTSSLYSGSFSATSKSVLSSGTSSGGGNPGGGGGPGGR
jgi:uncharacterized Zn ribbon protein